MDCPSRMARAIQEGREGKLWACTYTLALSLPEPQVPVEKIAPWQQTLITMNISGIKRATFMGSYHHPLYLPYGIYHYGGITWCLNVLDCGSICILDHRKLTVNWETLAIDHYLSGRCSDDQTFCEIRGERMSCGQMHHVGTQTFPLESPDDFTSFIT